MTTRKDSGLRSISRVGLSALHPLEAATISRVVTEPKGGVFALLRVAGAAICVLRVERSSEDLAADLLRAAKLGPQHGATHFEFFHIGSNLVSYALECRVYHDHRPPLNLRHPQPPSGWEVKCPEVGCPFGSTPSGVRLTQPSPDT